MAYAPDAIQALFDTVKKRMPAAQMGGIYADKPGYHNARNQLPSGDYSVQKPPDKEGDGAAASAIDITFGSAQPQYDASRRLLNAKNDPRMDVARSFFGSTDGANVCGWDYYGGYAVTSDDSHLWHVHLSVLRKYATNHAALQKVADVITGHASDGSSGSEDDDMPKRLQIKRDEPLRVNQVNTVWELKWDVQDWDTGNVFYGSNAPSGDQKGSWIATGVPDGASYVSTFTCVVKGLPEGKSFLTGLSWCDADGETTGGSAWHEWPSNGGDLYVTDTRVGYNNPGRGLKVRVQSPIAVDVTHPVWAVIHWPN